MMRHTLYSLYSNPIDLLESTRSQIIPLLFIFVIVGVFLQPIARRINAV